MPRLQLSTRSVRRRSEVEELDRAGRSALHYACADGDHDAAVNLLSEGADPNLPDRASWTPLHFAAQSNSVRTTEALLAAGARVDAIDEYGNSPLWRAVYASRGDGSLILLLRRNGADPHQENFSGVSPVQLARKIANYEVAQHFSDVPEENSAV